jgi:hypothetical protein
LAPAPSADSLPSHGAEFFPLTLADSERRAPYARVPCISLLASSPEHAGVGTPWRPLPWPELVQPVFFPNSGTQSSPGCGLPVLRASTSPGRPCDSPPALPIHLPQGRAPFIQAADCACAPGTTELASTTPSSPASMDARLPLPWRLCSSHTRCPTPCSYLQPPPLCSLRRGISSPRPTFVFPRFISSAWQGSRQAPASCSTSTSGRRPRAAAASSATSSTPQPSTSHSSSDALCCVALAKSDHPPSICAAVCAVVETHGELLAVPCSLNL